jgi:hypothetical protein
LILKKKTLVLFIFFLARLSDITTLGGSLMELVS